jgi:hypothetical protein
MTHKTGSILHNLNKMLQFLQFNRSYCFNIDKQENLNYCKLADINTFTYTYVLYEVDKAC